MKTFLLILVIGGGALGALHGVNSTERQLRSYQSRIEEETSDFGRNFLIVVRDRFWENRALYIAEYAVWGASPGGVAWVVMWLVGRAFRAVSGLVAKPVEAETRGSSLAEIVEALERKNALVARKDEGRVS